MKGNRPHPASSGTTGRPTVVGYTRDDIEMWSTCVARLAAAGGATDGNIAQISFGYGLFTGALGLHQGRRLARRLFRFRPAIPSARSI